MKLFHQEDGEGEITAYSYYGEDKVSVTFEGERERAQFYWGDGERHRDELEAIKAARAFIKGVTH